MGNSSWIRAAAIIRIDFLAAHAHWLALARQWPRIGHTVATQWPHSGHTWATHGPLCFTEVFAHPENWSYKSINNKAEATEPRAKNLDKIQWPMCGPCVAHVWPLCGHCVANAWPIRELAKPKKNMLSQARAMRTCSGRQTCDCCLHGPHIIGARPPVSHRVIPPIREDILCNFCESSGDEDEQESRATCCSTDHLAKSELTAPSAQ